MSGPSPDSVRVVFSHIINAIMHLATTAPSGVPAAQAAAQAAHNEVQSWFPPPDPANPATEADGDGPPAEPVADTPIPQDPTQPPAG